MTNGIRQPALFCNRITQSLFGLIFACFFAPCDQDTQASIQNRIGLLYNLTVVNFIGTLTYVAALRLFHKKRISLYESFLMILCSYLSCYCICFNL
jgi:ABC-type transport system involved in cytochrome c biogenesis permease subunit